MAERSGTLEQIATALATFLEPLEERMTAGDVRVLIAELGLQLPPSAEAHAGLVAQVTATGQHLARLRELIPELDTDDQVQAAVKALELALTAGLVVAGLRDIGQALKAAGAGGGIPPGELDAFADELPARLVDYLVVRRLEAVPGAVTALELIGGVRRTELPAVDAQHPAFVRRELDVDAITGFVTDPLGRLRTLYGWGDPGFDGAALLQTLHGLLTKAGVGSVLDTSVSPPVLDVVALQVAAETGAATPGLRVEVDHPLQIDAAPFVQDDWQVRVVGDLALALGAAIVVRPDDTVTFVPPGAQPVAGDVLVEWTGGSPTGTPYVILGEPAGSRLEARRLILRAGAGLAWDGAAGHATGSFRAGGEVQGGKVVIGMEQADGFLSSILGGFRLESDFDLGVAFSSRDGLHFTGSSALEIQVPLHRQLGPIEVRALTLSAGITPAGVPVGIGVDLKGALGPIQAVVEQVGVTALLSLPPDRAGRLGPVDFALAFRPPTGVGLSVDAGVVQGGGFLRIDAERGEYAGALELTFAGVLSLKAIGLITTKMPDGSKGFSLLIVITAEFGTGIQLGLGFTLVAVGGLVGINRTMRLQALMEGVRTGALESVMFPRDVIANAPKIISDLRTFFPPQQGTFLIGPMAKLGWGTPTIASVSVGVIIEIPGNIAIVGVLRVALPADDLAVLVLQVNFAGAIEFDRKRVYFFAGLFESRVLFVPIEGEMGLLAAFGDDADFVVSVGGFHPRFTPPPLPFPSPRRVSVSLVNTPTTRVRIDGYFAVTTNTAQFGAKAELFFGLDALNVQGHLGFDALFQFSPFHFIIEISASMSVKVFGVGLFSVRLRGSLEGPAPYRARGEASISLFFFDIDVDVDVTWGESRDTLLPPIDVLPLVKAELDKPESWQAFLPAGTSIGVALRRLPEGDPTLVLHPVGVLRVSQRRVPLELALDRVGSQRPADVKRLELRVEPGGLTRRGDALEQFAPAQFQDLDDADKLSRPAFGRERGGVELSAGDDLRSNRMVRRAVRYEEIILDNNYKRFARRFRPYSVLLFDHLLAGASITKSGLSRAHERRLQPFADKVAVHDEAFTVALQSTNRPFAAAFASEAAARDHLAQAVAADPSLAGELHVIPQFEAVT